MSLATLIQSASEGSFDIDMLYMWAIYIVYTYILYI